MNNFTHKIICPHCQEEIPIVIKEQKNNFLGNCFSQKECICDACGEIIDLSNVYYDYFYNDFEYITNKDLDELSDIISEIEESEDLFGTSRISSLKKDIYLLKMFLLNKQINLNKCSYLLDTILINLRDFTKFIKKKIGRRIIHVNLDTDFVFPNNIMKTYVNNILYTQYLLDFLLLAIPFVFNDLIIILYNASFSEKQLIIRNKIFQIIYHIELELLNLTDYFDFSEWNERAELLSNLMDLSIEICEPIIKKDGKMLGLTKEDKISFIKKYDCCLTPKFKKIAFEYMPSFLFKCTDGIDREDLLSPLSQTDWNNRKKRMKEIEIEKNVKVIKTILLNDFCEKKKIKLRKKDFYELGIFEKYEF